MTRQLCLSALLLIAGCRAAPQEDMPTPVALVKTAPVETGSATDALIVYGAAEAGPGGERSLSAPAEAILVSILAPNGTAVSVGQVVATLRPSPTSQLDFARARSDVLAANSVLARARRLRSDGLVSDAEVETARAAATNANATRDSLASRSGGLVLRAPVSGTVQALSARPGDVIAAGAVVATIAARGNLRARFGIDPVLAQRVRPGQTIQIAPVAGGAAIDARVVGVDPQVDAITRLASVFAQLPGGSVLAPGEPLRGTLAVGATSTGAMIPYGALLDDGGRSYVFVVRNGVAKVQDVTPGNSAGERIAILKGLASGDRVVTEGGTALEDGMKVREGAAKRAAK